MITILHVLYPIEQNPLSPHLRFLQRRPQAPPAKSKFLAIFLAMPPAKSKFLAIPSTAPSSASRQKQIPSNRSLQRRPQAPHAKSKFLAVVRPPRPLLLLAHTIVLALLAGPPPPAAAEAPPLTLQPLDQQHLELSWPASPPEAFVQASSNLEDWFTLDLPFESGVNRLTFDYGAGPRAQFFRTALVPRVVDILTSTTRLTELGPPLQNGKLAYSDRTFAFGNVPTDLLGLQTLVTANGDKFNTDPKFLTFTLTQQSVVYVAAPPPISASASSQTSGLKKQFPSSQ